ncbi:nucleoside diphosphate kinase regulator [Oxalobacteraceae bacterium R-40]|uniref:Nucleoside diphosphate kinase regulator n=1 Tax=Keguizhuia sedimenti TaxID=3064264 RepID=A0ABU1BKZ7_9BURK|nr:nucleoside diphosphate kinase regulator [Oxalobacteraceae bacterium R-40]
MEMKPNIILSSLDLERIEQLLESLPDSQYSMHASLLEEISRAEVMEPKDIPPTVATMNSTLRFVVEPSSMEVCATLVYPRDANGDQGKISVLAPIGTALLGLSVGECIEWMGPNGDRISVQLKEILYQPERAGELHR